MRSAAFQPRLRLVRDDDESSMDAWREQHAARADIARENVLSATNTALDPQDPRWVLATRAYSQLEGSTLTPERRQRVLRTAGRLGIRPFEANLIIAIVQDHARTGRQLDEVSGTLKLMHDPRAARTRSRNRSPALRWAAAMLVSIVATAWLIWWITG